MRNADARTSKPPPPPNPPAYPTLRIYLAAHAIDRCIDIAAQFVQAEPGFKGGEVGLSEVVARGVVMAYHVADAMILAAEPEPDDGVMAEQQFNYNRDVGASLDKYR